MIQRELQKILDILKTDDYITASKISEKLEVSEKTVRTRLKLLNDELQEHGANVVSKARFGYKLDIIDKGEFDKFFSAEQSENTTYIPDNGKERSEYLLAYLIWHKGYVKADMLCDFLYISKPTLTKSLRTVENILKRYELGIERKPNHGMKLIGRELDIRRLICDYFIRRNCLAEVTNEHIEKSLVKLATDIRKMLIKYDVPLSETAFENFAEYVYTACRRMRSECYLKDAIEELPDIGMREKAFAKELAEYLGKEYKCIVTSEEKSYILLYLLGKRIVGNSVDNDINFVIKEQLDRLALSMLDVIQKEYHMDFRNDFDVRMTLNQHLVPLDIRLRFDIPLHNPMLDEIKSNYSLAYQISCEAVQKLSEYYHKEISEDEIGYIALIFELAIEREKKGDKSDILVVCSSGKGSSRLLKYKYEQEFSEYLDHIYVCDLMGLETFDFSKVHYVFTTVPITKEIKVPIVEVGMFLGQEDVKKVTDILRKGPGGFVETYYRPERFICDMEAETKDEVLEQLCKIIMKQEKVDDNFYELVLERESYVQMNYGNLIAIPHPNQIASEETFAYVAVLDHPIPWNEQEVQVVLLTSIGRKEDKNRQKFYEATARFSLSRSAIEQLIAMPEYEVLLELLK